LSADPTGAACRPPIWDLERFTVGADDNADKVFWNTQSASGYTDNGAAGVGVFRLDTGWGADGTVPIEIKAGA
jgi:hypothetical protein